VIVRDQQAWRTPSRSRGRIVAHANFADSATLAAMAQRRVWVIPTLHSLARDSTSAHSRALFDTWRGVSSRCRLRSALHAGVIRHGATQVSSIS
jgi:hypothetical protein